LVLAHAPVVGLEDLQAIRFGGPAPRPDASKPVSKIPIAIGAVVLGHAQVQHHQLITLAGVLERSVMRGFNAYRPLLAGHTHRALGQSSPDMDLPTTLDAFNQYISES
jgi:hypothetical protein